MPSFGNCYFPLHNEVPVGLLIRRLGFLATEAVTVGTQGSPWSSWAHTLGCVCLEYKNLTSLLLQPFLKAVDVVGNTGSQDIVSSWTKSRFACSKSSGSPGLVIGTRLHAWCSSRLGHLGCSGETGGGLMQP